MKQRSIEQRDPRPLCVCRLELCLMALFLELPDQPFAVPDLAF